MNFGCLCYVLQVFGADVDEIWLRTLLFEFLEVGAGHSGFGWA